MRKWQWFSEKEGITILIIPRDLVVSCKAIIEFSSFILLILIKYKHIMDSVYDPFILLPYCSSGVCICIGPSKGQITSW